MMIVSVPASEPLPLDAVASALVAFGFRKLRSSYAGNCVGLTRSNDNAVANIGFTAAGDIDEAAIATHVGANNGTIGTWYDQSGNATNAVNATVANQPTLVTSGTVKRNHGKPVAEFRGDSLDITLGSAKANDVLTIVAVVQSRTAWHTDNVTWLSMPTNKLEVRMNAQSVRVWSWDGAANNSQSGDPFDRGFVSVRPVIVAVRLDGDSHESIYNNSAVEWWTLPNHGATGTTLRLCASIAGHDADISELLVYDRVLTDAEITKLYRSLNQYHAIGPDDPINDYTVRSRWPADPVLLKWMREIPPGELDVTRGNLSWDGTYANTDELMRISLVFDGGFANYQEHSRALVAHRDWFRLGIMDDGVTFFQFEPGGHGTEAGTLALFYANSLPKAAGAQGNPYYNQRAVGLRSLICAAYSLMAFMGNAEQNEPNHQTDFIGGNLMASAFAFRHCKDVAPLHVQSAFRDMLYLACQKLWWLNAHDVNANMDCKAVAGLAICSSIFSDNESWRTTCAQAAKRILFGSTTGTAATTDKVAGIYSAAGYIDEGDSPETTYNGHSLNWLQEAYRATAGDPLWSFLQDVVEDMITFKTYQYFPDPDGYVDGPSGYAGRTGGSYVFDQGTEAWRQHNSAAIVAVGRHLGDTLGNEAALISDINTRIGQWNGSVNIDDDCILVSGTAAAHTNGGASTTVTLTNSPNLSVLSVDQNAGIDWRAWLWVDVNGGTWSVLSAFDDTANTVTGTVSFNIASGAAVDYRIEKGPKVWGSNSTWWPPENYYPVPDGYYDQMRALILATDTSLQTPWESTANHNVNFGDEFWSYKNSDGSRDFGFFVEAVENSGSYSGWWGGTLQQFWTRDTGTVICARHDKSGSQAELLENTRVWSLIDSWATTHVYGIDDSDKAFSTAAINGNAISPSSTFDVNGTPKSVEHEATIQGGVTSGFDAGTSISGSIFYRNTFEALADGLRHLVEVTHTGGGGSTEFLYPATPNVTQTNFTGGFADMDEGTTPSDADFAWSTNNTIATLEVSTGNPSEALSGTITVKYRIAKTNAGAVDGGGSSLTVTASVVQGTTVLASDTARTPTGTWTQYQFTFAASLVSDWNDLRLRFVTTASGGTAANRRGCGISWAEVSGATPADPIKELWATIPVYLRDTDQSMSDTTIEYWNGSAWATLSTTLVSTDAIRLGRNFGSGAKYAYIEFAASQSVKLNAAVWVQSYQGNSRHRMIKINILGATPDGTGKAFPAATSVDYSVVTTNPHP